MYWTVNEDEDPMVFDNGGWNALDGLAAACGDEPLPAAWVRFFKLC